MPQIVLTMICVLLALCSPAVSAAADGAVVIDMRHGLPESRIRALLSLPDGRLAIATAGYVSVFDGVTFVSESVDPEKGVKLMSTGKNRQLFRDSDGFLWLKTPATRHDETGRLYAFDPFTAADVTESRLIGLDKSDLKDFFVDEKGRIWIIGNDDVLSGYSDGKAEPLLALGNISRELPSYVSAPDSLLYLCYDDGKVCEVEIVSGLVRTVSAPPLPVTNTRIANGGVKWNGGTMWIVFHRRNDNGNTWFAGFDPTARKWRTEHEATLIEGFTFDAGDAPVAGPETDGDEVFALTTARNGALWVGTRNNGLRYVSRRDGSLITLGNGKYPYQRSGYYSSERARRLAETYASGVLNCSAEDTVTGRVYLGTRKGLVVIDRDDRVVATLDCRTGGLPNSNVQSIVANVGAKGTEGGDVWFSTTTGLSRLRHLGGDTVAVINLGLLDGLNLDGSELPSQMMGLDSAGRIVAAYPGGTLSFDPEDVDGLDYVCHRWPDGSSVSDGHDSARRWLRPVILVAVVLVTLFFLLIRLRLRRKQTGNVGADGPIESGIADSVCDSIVNRCRDNASDNGKSGPDADREFSEKLNRIISERLGDEDLNVVTLSRQMAMDRTNLYRRMQSVMGVSPSVYIRNMRLTAASRLLRETEMPVAEIAAATGFSSAKYFSSTFKDAFGMLPAAYRAENLNV